MADLLKLLHIGVPTALRALNTARNRELGTRVGLAEGSGDSRACCPADIGEQPRPPPHPCRAVHMYGTLTWPEPAESRVGAHATEEPVVPSRPRPDAEQQPAAPQR
jgi:hypothetical protein